MRIWRLKPLSLTSHHWKASTYRGNVIVRAESEANARRLATQAFWIATEKIPLKEVPANPEHAEVLRCIEAGAKTAEDVEKMTGGRISAKEAAWYMD